MNDVVKGSESQLAHERSFARDLAEQLVQAAKKAGAEACDATVGISSSLSAKARDGEVEDITRSNSRAAGIRVIIDGRLGFATSAQCPTTPEEVEALALDALELAQISTASDANVLPLATALTGDELEKRVRNLQLSDDAIFEVKAEWATENALLMERVVSGTKGVDTVRDCSAGSRYGVFALASSNGFAGDYSATSAHLSASAVAKDGEHKKQVESEWDASRFLNKLDAAEGIAKSAAEKVLQRLGAKKIASTRAPVLFDPACARTFLGAMLGAINGESVARGASFLSEAQHQKVWIPGHAIVDNPLIPGAFGSQPFDGEGLEVQATPLFDDEGKLLTFLNDARSAKRLGVKPGGHASRGSMGLPSPSSSNVVVQGGAGDLASLIKETERGFLVTHLLGHSPNGITGEYSRGAAGFWIEDGAIAFPVEELTIAGTMKEMMLGIDRMCDDAEDRSSHRIGSLRFAELAISGT
ncbi:MAG: TldD/PmbA family protein [Deltaproteobacteria bacterium]|nr:TldD/PmbA family protein [Deltaproteobacteria bacterium]